MDSTAPTCSLHKTKSLVKYKKANPSPATKEHLKSQHTRSSINAEVKGREGTLRNQVKFPGGVSA